MLRATQTFHVGTKDGTRTINEGDLLDPVDEAVKGNEALFEDSGQERKTPARSKKPAPKQP